MRKKTVFVVFCDVCETVYSVHKTGKGAERASRSHIQEYHPSIDDANYCDYMYEEFDLKED